MPIRVLPVHLVNKIAAGEVIERPASIVKELVENSLDAGATRIDVAIEDGGRKLIRVTDDGRGMDEGDLDLAFVPHATSKLAGEADLERIGTMGFRGEALASIASVSHARIRTCPADAGEGGGFEVEASGETVGPVRPCAAPPGTTVTIRDLFFNTPARRKFLRTANTEAGHVAEQLTRLALPYPQVAFSLRHNERTVQSLAAGEATAGRVGDLFGADLAEALVPIQSRGQGPVRVSGLAAAPSAGRASGKWQYVFLNGRYIRDRLIGHAIREAYRGLIDPNRWPVVFLFIEVDPAEVDVNVHPTKIEVRFRDGQAVHGEVLAALRETLQRSNLAPSARLESDEAGSAPGADGQDEKSRQRGESLREALADFFKSAPPPQPRLDFPPTGTAGRAPGGQMPSGASAGPDGAGAPWPAPPAPGAHDDPPRTSNAWPQAPAPAMGLSSPGAAGAPTASGVYGAIQIHNSYLVAPSEDGLVIVDQHALHERLIYNELRRRLADSPLTSQKLLIPETLTVTAREAACLGQREDLLRRLGIQVEAFGPNAVAVQSFPSLLAGRGVAVAEFLREFLDEMADHESDDGERMLESVLAMMACKAAVKAGQPLGAAEIDSLLARRDGAAKISACPHGRPTTLKLTLRDLEKQFKRT